MIQLSGSQVSEDGGSQPALISGLGGGLGLRFWLEVAAGFLVCVCFAAVAVPDINESHYLTKARHFWEPESCARDLFLQSTDAQWLFFFGTGWVTRFVSLETFAWTGRVVSWLMISASFVFLARGVRVRGILVPAILGLMLVLIRMGNLAGEWIVGGFEAKTIAWPLVLFAIGFGIRGRWSATWCLCGIAAAFHFVVGWWAFVCLAIVRLIQFSREGNSGPARMTIANLWGLFGSLVMGNQLIPGKGWRLWGVVAISLAGLVVGALPMLLDGAGVSQADSVAAARIQVLERLPHHLFFGEFSSSRVAPFGILVAVWSLMHFRVAMVGSSRIIGLLAMVTLGLDFCGLLLSGLADGGGIGSAWALGLLRLYWFRMADVIVPLSVALMCGQQLGIWWNHVSPVHSRIAKLVVCSLLVAIAVEGGSRFGNRVPPADVVGIAGAEVDSRRAAETARNWRRVCEWCGANTPENSLFLTPYGQQTFYWHSKRVEWFSWKHAPQDAIGLIEWSRRRELLLNLQNRFGSELPGWPGGALKWLIDQERIDYLMVPQREIDRNGVPTGLQLVYPESSSMKRTFCVLKPVATEPVSD